MSVVITIAVRRFVELIKDDFRLHLETYVISRFCCNFSIIPLACQTFSNSDLGVKLARACEKEQEKVGQVVKTATKQVISHHLIESFRSHEGYGKQNFTAIISFLSHSIMFTDYATGELIGELYT